MAVFSNIIARTLNENDEQLPPQAVTEKIIVDFTETIQEHYIQYQSVVLYINNKSFPIPLDNTTHGPVQRNSISYTCKKTFEFDM